MIILK
jgi:hypothetical protein